MIDWPEKEHYTAEDLVEIIRILRRPDGCPWDRVQTHRSIRKNFLEETCEALEAIDADDPQLLREELGDVLMQVAFHAVLEEEAGRSTFAEICREVCEKLVYRHPHVFASAAAQNAGINGWDALKNKEKGRRTLADELDIAAGRNISFLYNVEFKGTSFFHTALNAFKMEKVTFLSSSFSENLKELKGVSLNLESAASILKNFDITLDLSL